MDGLRQQTAMVQIRDTRISKLEESEAEWHAAADAARHEIRQYVELVETLEAKLDEKARAAEQNEATNTPCPMAAHTDARHTDYLFRARGHMCHGIAAGIDGSVARAC